MLTPPKKTLSGAWIAALMLSGLAAAEAGQIGNLTYSVLPASITITDCNEEASGVIAIPTSIEGKPVTAIDSDAFDFCFSLTGITIPSGVTTIGSFAFNSCTGLTSLTLPDGIVSIGNSAFQACSSLTSIAIPASVTHLGNSAFNGCSGLTEISVHPLNSQYSSSNGVLYNQTQSTLIQCPLAKTGSIIIPGSVTAVGSLAFESCSGIASVTFPNGLASIGGSAFYGCSGLTSIDLPSSITSIGAWAFQSCANLTSATFAGNAPAMASAVFDFAAPSFTVYYHNGSTGFTSPTWLGYPAVSLSNPSPIASWLTSHGFPTNADLNSDPNRDGVSLLLAYAFNLNPHQNLSGSMPRATLAANQLSLTYYAGSAGVTYTVQTCNDLQSWTSTGVTLTAPDANQLRTATVAAGNSRRFMRIVINP